MYKKIVIALFLMAAGAFITLPIVSSALSTQQAEYRPNSVISGAYRYWDNANDTITGSADDSDETTFTLRFVPDVIFISWDDATNPLHVQFTTADADTTYIQKSDVMWVEPGETFPFYGRDVTSVKVDLTVAADEGQVRINYYKI